MKGDFFINNMVSACSDIVAYIVSGIFIERLGLRPSYLSSFTVCFIGAGLYLAFRNGHPSLVPLFLLVSNFGTSWCVNIDWNANAMLFPVIYSSSTNGFCNLFARLSNILAPQFAEFTQPTPILIFTGTCAVGAILSVFLKQ
jgi:hypothetical protein